MCGEFEKKQKLRCHDTGGVGSEEKRRRAEQSTTGWWWFVGEVVMKFFRAGPFTDLLLWPWSVSGYRRRALALVPAEIQTSSFRLGKVTMAAWSGVRKATPAEGPRPTRGGSKVARDGIVLENGSRQADT